MHKIQMISDTFTYKKKEAYITVCKRHASIEISHFYKYPGWK